MNEPALETLCRWETGGGHWLVLSRRPAGMIVSLLRCDGGEEMQRIASADPAFEAYIGSRDSSQSEPDHPFDPDALGGFLDIDEAAGRA